MFMNLDLENILGFYAQRGRLHGNRGNALVRSFSSNSNSNCSCGVARVQFSVATTTILEWLNDSCPNICLSAARHAHTHSKVII